MSAPWAATPPESNYVVLARGAGEATTLASGEAWQAQTLESLLHAELSELNTAVTGVSWIGASGAASALSATVMNGLLGALSGWAGSTVPITTAAAAGYRAAVSGMIPDVLCLENRAEQQKDVDINPLVLGALTPDIIRLDGTYFGDYWTQNATSGISYDALLDGFIPMLGIPPPVGPLSVSPAAPAAAAEQVAEATADGGIGDAMRESTSAGMQTIDQMGSGAGPMGAAQTLMEPVMSAAQAPLSAAQSVGSSLGNPLQSAAAPLQSAIGMFNMFGGAGGPGAAAAMSPGAGAADAMLPAATAGESAGAAATAGGVGFGGTGTGGLAAATAGSSYMRPASSFSPESGGAASYAKPGAALVGASAAPVAGGPVAPVGMLRPGGTGKESGKDYEAKTVRLTTATNSAPASPLI